MGRGPSSSGRFTASCWMSLHGREHSTSGTLRIGLSVSTPSDPKDRSRKRCRAPAPGQERSFDPAQTLPSKAAIRPTQISRLTFATRKSLSALAQAVCRKNERLCDNLLCVHLHKTLGGSVITGLMTYCSASTISRLFVLMWTLSRAPIPTNAPQAGPR